MFIAAQVFSLLGAILLLISTFGKNKETMLSIQIFDSTCNCIADILLGGWAGAVLCVSAIVRNILVIKHKQNNVSLVLFIIITAVVSIAVNKAGFIPLIACIEYTIAVMKLDIQKTKIALALNLFMWFIYDLIIKSYPVAVSDIIILVMTIININKTSDERNGSDRVISIKIEK